MLVYTLNLNSYTIKLTQYIQILQINNNTNYTNLFLN